MKHKSTQIILRVYAYVLPHQIKKKDLEMTMVLFNFKKYTQIFTKRLLLESDCNPHKYKL